MFLDTLKCQEAQGHYVLVVVPPAGINAKKLKQDNINIISFPVRSSKFDLWAVKKLKDVIKKEKIDIVHTHLTSSALLGSIAAKWAGVPVAASVLKMAKKRFYMGCDKMFPCSDAVYQSLIDQNVPPEKMKRIYTGINLKNYINASPKKNLRKEFGFAEDDKIIGTIARLVPMKGHTYLLDAAVEVVKNHPKAKFLIVGDGELLPELVKKTKQLHLQDAVKFVGTRNDLLDILNSIDVSVLASIEKEGLPMILVESALMKVPVVMTDVAGIKEIIENAKSGFLVPPKNPKALAESICKILSEPQNARRMAQAAYNFVVKEFDVEKTTLEIEKEYQKLLR